MALCPLVPNPAATPFSNPAARGSTHLRVGKTVEGDVTLTRVEALAPDERREEIARMLAGARITDEARAAAKRLLDGAEG